MGADTSAGTIIAISAADPATYDVAGFGALTYLDIGEVTNIDGQLGRIYNLITHTPLASRTVRKYKGSRNAGSANVAMALDFGDPGQDLARTALNDDEAYSFRITLPSGVIIFYQAMVMSFPIVIGNTEAITTANMNIEVTAAADGTDYVIDE